MKNTRNLLILIGITALAGGLWWFLGHDDGQTGGNLPEAARPQPVAVLQLKPETITFTQELPGRVSPYRQSQVRPQVDGIVTRRMFVEGADVKKGQQLYQIDDARYKALLNSARADLASAQANVKTIAARAQRYEELVKIKAISQQEFDDIRSQLHQAQAAVAVAQAAVDLARVNLSYTKVYAPIDGQISRSFVTEGALVTTNQTQHLAIITQLDPVYIDMQQSSTDAVHLRSRIKDKASIPVDLIFDDKTSKASRYEGTLKFSEVTVNETTGSVALRALIPNPDGFLLPGLFVRARLNLGQDEVLLVPQRVTTRTPDGNLMVWVVDENNQAQKRSIQTEQAYQDNWVVTAGLKAGDIVIVEGYLKVGPGAPVAPSPWKQAGGNPAGTAKQPGSKG